MFRVRAMGKRQLRENLGIKSRAYTPNGISLIGLILKSLIGPVLEVSKNNTALALSINDFYSCYPLGSDFAPKPSLQNPGAGGGVSVTAAYMFLVADPCAPNPLTPKFRRCGISVCQDSDVSPTGRQRRRRRNWRPQVP